MEFTYFLIGIFLGCVAPSFAVYVVMQRNAKLRKQLQELQN